MGERKLFSAREGLQISIFIENRPGTLGQVIDLLRANKVNMLALSLSEGLEFGYCRIVVDEYERAVAALRSHGHLVLEKKVVLLEVANKPGGLAAAIDRWARAGINIEYAYSAAGQGTGNSLIVAKVDHPRKAIAALGLAARTPSKL